MSNRLAHETSPYLLQHQHNPVDWYPWGPEAFAKAREEGKVIFLSVGYSTCYWCHVMERQCFENPEIARLMNERFINIKVDREERPDVDQLYMTAVQVMTRHGGWPMSVWLTPDLRPFFGGTYFPPEDMQGPGGGRPGFPRLIEGLEDAWKNRREEIGQTADQLLGVLHQLATPRRPEQEIKFDGVKLDEYVKRSISDFEQVHGGFGSANGPKFPRQTLLKLLLTYIDGPAKRDPLVVRAVRGMLVQTLEAMDRGGIHDHLGGGFHRYSVDGRWLVPHFEIMLYDQAMLAEVYAIASRVFERADFGEVARGICDFVLREMTSEQGAFYTAFDAEVDHREGLNYLWTQAEIGSLLTAEEAALFNCVYGVDQGPNFADPHHGTGQPEANILFLDRSLAQASHDHGIPLDELKAKLAGMRAKLKAARDARKQPLLDTKILTGWNALMASALAVCGRELNEPSYTEAAKRNCEFLLAAHVKDGALLRTSRNGAAKYAAFLDDYAALSLACYQVGMTEQAGKLVEDMLERFGAHACHPKEEGGEEHGHACGGEGSCGGGGCGSCTSGGLFFTDESADDLIVRQKVGTDSPLPSGNAMALEVLRLLGNRDRARAIVLDFAQLVEDNAEGMSALVESMMKLVRTGGKEGAIVVPASATPNDMPASPETLARSVVEIEARFASPTEMQVRLSIREGFHIHAADTATSGYIATRLELEGAETLYPPAEQVKFAFAPEELSVYRGQPVFTVRFAAAPTGVIRGQLVFQPCDETSCLPPVTRGIEIHAG